MIYPLFLDARPEYMAGSRESVSLLLAPFGDSRLVTALRSMAGMTERPLTVLPTFPISDGYRRAIASACGANVLPLEEFQPAGYEASDWFLLADPRLLCTDPLRLPAMLKDGTRLQARATHLVAMARHSGGTNEHVEVDTDGRVRRIQRYFDTATWPQITGVACSLVSASCLRTSKEPLRFASLIELRTALTQRGVPSRDVAIQGDVYDLARATELVRLNERIVLSRPAPAHAAATHAPGASVHPTATLIGPVILHHGAEVGAGAVLIGPTVIGSGASISPGATVAHAVVADGVTIPPGATYRYAVACADVPPALVGLAEPASGDFDWPGTPELDVDTPPLRRRLYPRVKLAIDRTIAAISLVLLSPLFAAIALLIKLDSAGSVFFADLREGLDGRLFRCWKFRTMCQGANLKQRELLAANDVDGPQFKLEKDPRLTRVGRWLRPMSFDELPQLFNVLLGEMSLIGPRPSPFRENQRCVPWRDARLSVRPGITGLWQVCRHDRPDGDFHQWIYFDLLYVQHMSFWLDLKILIATLLTRGGQASVPLQQLLPAARLRT